MISAQVQSNRKKLHPIIKTVIIFLLEDTVIGFINEVNEGSVVFAIIADQSRDCSNKEQMPLIIPYVTRLMRVL